MCGGKKEENIVEKRASAVFGAGSDNKNNQSVQRVSLGLGNPWDDLRVLQYYVQIRKIKNASGICLDGFCLQLPYSIL